MKILQIASFACAAVALASCATPYQDLGVLGGVQAARISSDTVQITARGNAYTDPDTIQRYALRKAAEETLAAGYDLFAIGGDVNRDQLGAVSGAYGAGGFGGAWATGSSWQIIKPGQTLIIRLSKYPKPNPMPTGLFDAHEVAQYLTTGTYVPPAPEK